MKTVIITILLMMFSGSLGFIACSILSAGSKADDLLYKGDQCNDK